MNQQQQNIDKAFGKAFEAERQADGAQWTMMYWLAWAIVYALVDIACAIRGKE